MEWDHLRFMLAIHRGGSMQAASERLGVDRATVLRRLDALEAGLRVRLFERRRDGCFLTAAGQEIIGTVENIEAAMTALAHKVRDEGGRAEGLVTVTVPEFIAAKVLVPALPQLHAAYPGIEIALNTGMGFLNLVRGEADIALRNRRPDQNTLVARRVGSVAIGIFASKAYLARRGEPGPDFAGHDLALFDHSLAGMPGIAAFEERLRGRVVLRSNEILPLLAAARAGLGVAVIPAVAASGEPDLVPVPPGAIGRPEIFLITHRELRGRAVVRTVFDFMVGVFHARRVELAAEALDRLRPPERAPA